MQKKSPRKNTEPIFVEFSNLIKEDKHHHLEMEIILLLRGSLKCKINSLDYMLVKGDMVIMDTEDLHQIYFGSPDALFLRIYIDLGEFKYLHPNLENMVFVCERYTLSKYDKKISEYEEKLIELRKKLVEVGHAYFETKGQVQKAIEETLTLLIEKFRGFFVYKNNFFSTYGEIQTIDLDRIERIINYICSNLEQKITLEEIAEKEHLNSYYLSHLVKKKFGTSFQGLINYLRLEEAEKMMVDTDLLLTQISGFCGFSSLQYMKKCFLEYYGISPQEYRDSIKKSPEEIGSGFDLTDAMDMLNEYAAQKMREKNEKIKIKLEEKTQPKKFKKEINLIATSQPEYETLLKFSKELQEIEPVAILEEKGENIKSKANFEALSSNKIEVPVRDLIYKNRFTFLYGVLMLLAKTKGDILYEENGICLVQEENKLQILIINMTKEERNIKLEIDDIYGSGIMFKRVVKNYDHLNTQENIDNTYKMNKVALGVLTPMEFEAKGKLALSLNGEPMTAIRIELGFGNN